MKESRFVAGLPGEVVSRRDFLRTAGALGLTAGVDMLLPGWARSGIRTTGAIQAQRTGNRALYELAIRETPIRIGRRRATATTIDGTVPGPLLRFKEGEEAVIRVSNALRQDTSIHWHGIILPTEMDGVPGLSFDGIQPREVFEYRFPIQQYGTYWYHSHSAFQEQAGHYGPLIIDPADGYPYRFDREYVVMFSDWTFENPHKVLDRLKKVPDYYNYQQRTVFDFFKDVARHGLGSTIKDRAMWAEMRMNPTDISDITGATYTYLVNGLAPETNWTGLFRPGERVLLRFINASSATYFDVRIPGLPMTVVQAIGQFNQPVETDEIRIAIAETYDVIIEPKEDRAYTLFAEAMDRSGYARGTLAPREGMSAPIPERRKRPILSMADMGMSHEGMDHGNMPGMDHGNMPGMEMPADTARVDPHAGHNMPGMQMPADTVKVDPHAGHNMAGQDRGGMKDMGGMRAEDSVKLAVAGQIRTSGLRAPGTLPTMVTHEDDRHGPGNAAVPDMVQSRLEEPGIGLGDDGWRVFLYSDLRALHPREDFRAPDREIEMHLTGNMERYMWSIDGVPFGDADPIHLNYGERLRLTLVNDTMMNHPMHLHGMWMELENGHGAMIPRVHTVNVKPAERLSLLITVDNPGRWAFHCHILYHMDTGMFREMRVPQPVASEGHHGH